MKVFLRKGRFLLLLLVVIGVLFGTFFSFKLPDFVIFLTLVAWWGVILGWSLGAEFSFLAGAIVVIISFFSVFFFKNPIDQFIPPEKALVWFYLFFLSGIIQIFLESKGKPKTLINIWDGLEKLKNLKNYKFNRGAIPKSFNVKFFTTRLGAIDQLIKTAVYVENLLVALFRAVLNEIRRFFEEVFGFSVSLTSLLPKMSFVKFQNSLKNSIILQKILKVPIVQLIISFFVLKNIYEEVVFYQWFYEEEFSKILFRQIFNKLLVLWLVVFLLTFLFVLTKSKLGKIVNELSNKEKKSLSILLGSLLFIFGLSERKKEETIILKSNFIFGTVFLLVLYFGDRNLFFKTRDKFEFRPYITEVYYDLASRYSEVVLYGHNFKEMPFMGEVYIKEKTQKIKEWGDKKIIIEIDPILSSSGNLKVVNDYGFGKRIESNIRYFDYFDSKKTTPEKEKRFWATLKEVARKRSEENEEDE